MQLTVVTPTYNEADNLPRLVSALFSLPIPGLKVLVVDDNSPDGTGEIAEQLTGAYPGCLHVIHRSGKLGLGTAYIQGFRQAISQGAEFVAQMDADFSHPPELLVDLQRVLQTCDVAMGSRYIPGGSVDQDWPTWRKALSSFGNIYARTILRLPIRDTTGGYRMWRREALQGMPLERVRSNGYAFQIEMAYLANRLGYSFREVPFYFADRLMGQSKMSFNIQKEAALRVWQLLFEYRHLQRA
ncbi:MAG TPA: polyprenol monophosphomannose synthase [Anaerolineales bacterium]|nr:polyprenol monophosphomannose synthase [Anaerolineales bacterium]